VYFEYNKPNSTMKLLLISLTLILSNFSSNLLSQSNLPALKSNAEAKILINSELNELYSLYKTNPTLELERKISLYNKASEILEEKTGIPPTTEYALNSAFLYMEIAVNGAQTDSEALFRLRNKMWSTSFVDLINLVKK